MNEWSRQWTLTWTSLVQFPVVEQRFTSPPTQYRLNGETVLQVKRPNQQCQSTDGKDATKEKKFPTILVLVLGDVRNGTEKRRQAWAQEIFIFRTEKFWNFRTFFRTSERRIYIKIASWTNAKIQHLPETSYKVCVVFLLPLAVPQHKLGRLT